MGMRYRWQDKSAVRISNTSWTQLLDEGYQLDIDTPTGKQLFASKQAFGAWFDAIQC
jgi:hypothetical protein